MLNRSYSFQGAFGLTEGQQVSDEPGQYVKTAAGGLRGDNFGRFHLSLNGIDLHHQVGETTTEAADVSVSWPSGNPGARKSSSQLGGVTEARRSDKATAVVRLHLELLDINSEEFSEPGTQCAAQSVPRIKRASPRERTSENILSRNGNHGPLTSTQTDTPDSHEVVV